MPSLCIALFVVCAGCGGKVEDGGISNSTVSPPVVSMPGDAEAAEDVGCDGVVSWLSWFVSGEFGKCDGYVRNASHRLSGVRGEEIYRRLAGVVTGVSVDDWWSEGDDVWCSVTVTVRQFEPFSSYQFPDGYFEDSRGAYMRGDLDADGFMAALQAAYDKAWDEGVFRVSEGSQTVVYQLVQRDGYVDGTEYLVESLLVESGLLSNLVDYSGNVKSLVDGLIK